MFYLTYHGETSATASRRDMEDARGGNSVGSGGNSVVDVLHRDTTGNHGAVSSVATDI